MNYSRWCLNNNTCKKSYQIKAKNDHGVGAMGIVSDPIA